MRPHWRGTLLYPASLVALFLGLQGLLGLLGVPVAQQASLAALPSTGAPPTAVAVALRKVARSTDVSKTQRSEAARAM